MHSPASVFAMCLLCGALAAPGCSRDGPIADNKGALPQGPTLREVPAAKLPEIGDPSPTSDPALEAAGPQGWKRLQRNDEEYLIGWHGGSNPNNLPRIILRVANWEGQAEDTTPENLIELTAEIGESLKPTKDILEPPQPMLLGGEPWVRYVAEARRGNAKAEKQILQRVVNGKLYTVELQVYTRKIKESRDQAYAVAAQLKFNADETTSSETSSEAPHAADPGGRVPEEPPPAEAPTRPDP